jgi:hypothetical protein
MNLSPAQATVPKMGLHWIDTNSPELPPRSQAFTATFIIGSWDGKVIFDEPGPARRGDRERRHHPGPSLVAATSPLVST